VKHLFLLSSLTSLSALFLAALNPVLAQGQSLAAASLDSRGSDTSAFFANSLSGTAYEAEPGSSFPSAPEPAAAGYDHYDVVPSAKWHQIPFSRVGVGADVSPLGIGIKSAIVLNHYFDARAMGNFLSINTGNFKVEGFAVNANFHFDSVAAALDFYPWGSVFRISPGALFVNGNQVTVTSDIDPGTSFTLDGKTYYSAKANAATGAVPLSGSGVLGLHNHVPAPTITAGFGKFIPRSDRHWSFPSEFGVAFTGAPTANVNVAGWACTDPHYIHCSDVGAPTNPVAIEFNNSLQTQLAKWRKDLGAVTIYPLFSYSVMYSFNIR